MRKAELHVCVLVNCIPILQLYKAKHNSPLFRRATQLSEYQLGLRGAQTGLVQHDYGSSHPILAQPSFSLSPSPPIDAEYFFRVSPSILFSDASSNDLMRGLAVFLLLKKESSWPLDPSLF